MITKFQGLFFLGTTCVLASLSGFVSAANESQVDVADSVLAEQRAALQKNTKDMGYGPQSPRDIDSVAGQNTRVFETAPGYTEMNLCNLHFHEGTEHRGGEFTRYVGNGNGEGYSGGYEYSGELSESELAKIDTVIGAGENGDLQPGDTIEVHYVFTSAKVEPGPTLNSCFSDAIKNPQLRVETQVYVLVNDDNALDFVQLNKVETVNGLYQAPNIPNNTGSPVNYSGSTTGPGYNETGSPFQVSWSVRPKVAKVSVLSVGSWLKDNIFDEHHAHGVRNLVINPDLLSEM